MRVCLIGPGNPDVHYTELLGISKEDITKHISEISDVLVKANVDLVLLPDYGTPIEIAKEVKKKGKNKIIATVPKDDVELGHDNLLPFLELKVKDKFLFDEQINSGDWFKQDMEMCLFGDVVLYLGTTLGSLGELSYGFYLYRILKDKVRILNKEIVSGKNMQFTLIVYAPFVRDTLPSEIEHYIEKANGKVIYVNNAKELEKILSSIFKI